MKPSGWSCRRCRAELMYYDIGFDDGYQCPTCKRILEYYELRKEADRIDGGPPENDRHMKERPT